MAPVLSRSHPQRQTTAGASADDEDVSMGDGDDLVERVHERRDEILTEEQRRIMVPNHIVARNDLVRVQHRRIALTGLIEHNDGVALGWIELETFGVKLAY